jgi:DNA-directed RNA polymerase subunit RPC12/RpoP
MSETIEFSALTSLANVLKTIRGISIKLQEIDEEARRKSFTLSYPGKLETFEYPEKIICSCGYQTSIPDRTDIIICPVCGNKISVTVKTSIYKEEYAPPEDTLIFTNIEVSASKPTVVVGDAKAKENVVTISGIAKRFKELRDLKEKLQNEFWALKEKIENNVDYKILVKKIYNFFYKNTTLAIRFDREKFIAKAIFSDKIHVDVSAIPENYDKGAIEEDIVNSLLTIKSYFEE